MNTALPVLPTATPLAGLEMHADLLMLELKKHVILSDAGIAHIIGVIGRIPAEGPFSVLLKVPGEMDRSLEEWKDRLIESPQGLRIKAVVMVTESPLFGVRTQVYLGRSRAPLAEHDKSARPEIRYEQALAQ
jgi:hypothetical protein